MRALVAEALGTFALVFAGCGAIMVDSKTQELGHLGVALAFGIVIMTLIYALGTRTVQAQTGDTFPAILPFKGGGYETHPGVGMWRRDGPRGHAG